MPAVNSSGLFFCKSSPENTCFPGFFTPRTIFRRIFSQPHFRPKPAGDTHYLPHNILHAVLHFLSLFALFHSFAISFAYILHFRPPD